MRFPSAIAHYAAIGSRCWNSTHPKIKKIVGVLIQLQERTVQRRISDDALRSVAHITSNTFYGFIVPSRYAGKTIAMEVPNRLLQIAQEEGLPVVEPLVTEDFYLNTVEGYRNPYHHDISGFALPGTGLGQNVDGS